MDAPLLALTFGLALLLAESHLTAPLRAEIVRPLWLSAGVGCVQCGGFWVALAVAIAARWDGGGGLFAWSALTVAAPHWLPLLDALAASGVCGAVGRLLAPERAGTAPVAPGRR